MHHDAQKVDTLSSLVDILMSSPACHMCQLQVRKRVTRLRKFWIGSRKSKLPAVMAEKLSTESSQISRVPSAWQVRARRCDSGMSTKDPFCCSQMTRGHGRLASPLHLSLDTAHAQVCFQNFCSLQLCFCQSFSISSRAFLCLNCCLL